MKTLINKINAGLLAAFLALAPVVASAQTIGPSSYARTIVSFTTGSSSWVVPPNVTMVSLSGCAPGGPGGGGQASAATAGGGGGGAAMCMRGFEVPVTPGSTLTITIPTPPSGPAAGATGSTAGNLTIAGLPTGWGTLTWYGGCAGVVGAAGVGGVGGGGGGVCQAIGLGQAGGLAGAAGGNAQPSSDPYWTGLGGGGGGATAGTAGASGAYASNVILGNLFGIMRGLAGSGNGAGGGGGGTIFGQGVNGTAAGVACNASPTFVGFGMGGCGGGTNAAGGPGGPGLLLIAY